MKNLRTIVCCFSLSLYCITTSAQQKPIPLNEPDLNKPELFKQSPDKIPLEVFEVASLLTTHVGEPVVLDLPSFRFEGKVISSVSKYSNSMHSVIIRSSNYEGATLTITRTADESGNISYTGRIISLKNGDLYELKQVDYGFALVKNKSYKVIVE